MYSTTTAVVQHPSRLLLLWGLGWALGSWNLGLDLRPCKDRQKKKSSGRSDMSRTPKLRWAQRHASAESIAFSSNGIRRENPCAPPPL